ncbi:MAG: hypothetical protein Q4G61_10590 [Tissierellia bacterium]|nr:hypothetical protein [Tissierellia bacterium]
MKKNRTPQDSDFSNARKLEYSELTLYILSYLYSLYQICTNSISDKMFLLCSGLFLLAIFLVGEIKEKLFDSATDVRRTFLIDNAYGTKKQPHSNKEFYDNKDIESGLKRILANTHESSFFTSTITKKMLPSYVLSSVVLCGITVIFLFWNGLDEVSALLLNMILSGGFVKRTVSLYQLNRSTSQIFSEFNSLASDFENNPDFSKFESRVIDLVIRYETYVCSDRVSLSNKIYRENNVLLTKEWEQHKDYYLLYK